MEIMRARKADLHTKTVSTKLGSQWAGTHQHILLFIHLLAHGTRSSGFSFVVFDVHLFQGSELICGEPVALCNCVVEAQEIFI